MDIRGIAELVGIFLLIGLSITLHVLAGWAMLFFIAWIIRTCRGDNQTNA